jgi:hypothetical protein
VGKEKAPPRHEEGVRKEKGLNRRGSSNALLRDGSRNRGRFSILEWLDLTVTAYIHLGLISKY